MPFVRSVLLALFFGLSTGVAYAQPLGEVVLVPFGTGELTGALGATAALESELGDARVSLIPLHDARDRFTARSRPPQTASDSDLDVLARAAHDAIEHVAFGRTAAAQKSVREVISRAERTLESLNRETATARHILDACLSLVRSGLQSGKRDLALEQATRCRRLVPDLMPSEDAHPANVVGVLAEADNLLRRMRIGHLAVSSAPESGCAVYLNGRHLGSTPFRLDRAAAGDYRVQVECNRTLARVHLVQLGDQPVSLLVDTQLDRAVASDPRLLLRYASQREASEQGISHAVQLGRELGATDVILVAHREGETELLRIQVEQQRLVARATVPWSERHGFPRAGIERAVSTLAEARIEGRPGVKQSAEPVPEAPAYQEPAVEPTPSAEPAPSAQPEPNADAPAPQAPPAEPSAPTNTRTLRRAIGYSALALGVAFSAVGIGYDVRAKQLSNDLSELATLVEVDSPARRRLGELQDDFERASALRWLAMAGPALATATVFTVIEPRRSVPWWSYALAGAGVGLVVGGAVDVARRDECDLHGPETCRAKRDSGARGALLVSAALPFFSVPLAQWLRRSPESQLSFSTDLGQGRFTLTLHARY
ncbi:MAG: PEGA domain-containing protein [Polyangiales bacterium]